MDVPFVSGNRDLAVERTLSPRAQELIQKLDDARVAVARAEGRSGLPRVRWKNLYAYLGSSNPSEAAEAVAFIEQNVADLRAQLPAAKRRGKEAEAEQEWEAQALELDPHLSPAEIEVRHSGKSLWLWHGTSTALWPDIQRFGLQADPPGRAGEESTSGFVYLTADGDHAERFYARRAAAMFGGQPLLLRVAVPWDDLEYDADDEDIPSGRVQFMLGRDVGPSEIREASGERLANGWEDPDTVGRNDRGRVVEGTGFWDYDQRRWTRAPADGVYGPWWWGDSPNFKSQVFVQHNPDVGYEVRAAHGSQWESVRASDGPAVQDAIIELLVRDGRSATKARAVAERFPASSVVPYRKTAVAGPFRNPLESLKESLMPPRP